MSESTGITTYDQVRGLIKVSRPSTTFERTGRLSDTKTSDFPRIRHVRSSKSSFGLKTEKRVGQYHHISMSSVSIHGNS